MKRLRLHGLWLGVLVVLSACSSDDGALPQPMRSNVIAAYVETGLSENVAQCVVGLGERQMDLRTLDPSTSTESATQALIDEIVLSCVEAERLGNPDFDDGPTLAFIGESDVFGDDRKLDELWLWCEAGDGVACDTLWETAPIGSTYEQFGVTCGERFDVLDCAEELELPEGTTIDLSLLGGPTDSVSDDTETEDVDPQESNLEVDASEDDDGSDETVDEPPADAAVPMPL